MEVVVLVVDADVDLGLPESVDSNWVHQLLDFKAFNGIVLGVLDDRDQSVDAACREPGVAPLFEFVICAHARLLRLIKLLLQRSDEFAVLRVLPFVFLEVGFQCGAEIVFAHDFDDLFQERCALAV